MRTNLQTRNRSSFVLFGWLAPALLVMAMVASAAAQDAGGGGGLATRVFEIHFKEVSDIFLLIEGQVSEAGSIWMQPKLKTISITDRPAILDRIAVLIAEYDLPPRNVEVSFSLILASTSEIQGPDKPPTIREYFEYIRKIDEVTNRWGNYRLVGSATVVGTEGERSELKVGEQYRIGFLIEYAGERQGVVTVRLADFSLERLEADPENRPEFVPLLSTSLNLNRDQLYIFGASKSEAHDRALFVAISASTL
jgi:hypothetical protein